MLSSRKASALIVVIMISVILIIISSSVYASLVSSNTMVAEKVNRDKMYYVAESGMNYALKWLRNLKQSKFENYSNAKYAINEFNYGVISGNKLDKDINLDVKLNVRKNSSGSAIWSVTATGIHPETNKKCEITVDDILPVPALENCKMITGKFDDGFYYSPKQYCFGKSYYNDMIPLDYGGTFTFGSNRNPIFWGDVVTTSNASSIANKSHLQRWMRNNYNIKYWGITGWKSGFMGIRIPIFGWKHKTLYDYSTWKKGLDVKSDVFDTILGGKRFRNDLDDTFKANYSYGQPAVDYDKLALSDSWTNFTSKECYPNSYIFEDSFGDIPVNFPKNGDLYIKFKDGSIEVTGKNNKKVTINKNEKNLILIPKSYGKVTVTGIVDKSVTIITEASDIYVDEKFYAKNYDKYVDNNNFLSAFFHKDLMKNYKPWDSSHPINQIKNTANDVYIGLVAGLEEKADFHINPSSNFGWGSTWSNFKLITAAMYTPDGGLYAAKANSWGSDERILIHGCYIGKKENISNNSGFLKKDVILSTSTNPDFVHGARPLGFSSQTVLDQVTGNKENVIPAVADWSVSWK